MGGYFVLAKYNKFGESKAGPKESIVNLTNNLQTEDEKEKALTEKKQVEENIQQAETENKQPIESEQKNQNNAQKEEVKKKTEENAADIEMEKTEENSDSDALMISSKLISWGFEKSAGRKIDTIVIHSSYDAMGKDPFSMEGILAEYKQYGVSAHYLIGRKGEVWRLVRDEDIAYHAGVSKVPDGRTGVNAFSLGIEMVNTEDDNYTTAQYVALNELLAKLKKAYTIKYVLGHNQIAPGRKTDPWGIDWSKVKK